MRQTSLDEAGPEIAAVWSGASAGETERDVVVARDLRQTGIDQREVIGQPGVEVDILVGHQQVTAITQGPHGSAWSR